jgi:exonuclease 3'-5' domain-containing protein 1
MKPEKINPNISTVQLERVRKQIIEHGENFRAAADLRNQLGEWSTPPATTRTCNGEDDGGRPACPCEPGVVVDDATRTALDTLIQRLHRQLLLSMVHYQALKDLETMLQDLARYDQRELRLGVDLEGENLGRNGTATILQVYCNRNKKTYIIDLLTLQNSAFSIRAPGSTRTLRRILESPRIRKYFHDVRNDSDALYFHFGISLKNTLDTQLMENVTFHVESGTSVDAINKFNISGLPKCIQRDGGLDAEQLAEWNETKDSFKGDYTLMSKRPMTDRTIKYCVNDVKFLLRLADFYESRADEKQRRMYTIESESRITLSKSDAYNPEGPRDIKTAAPAWDPWRMNDCQYLLSWAAMGRMAICGRDCTNYWEQTHWCTEECACHAVCVQKMEEAKRRFDALSEEEKEHRVQAAEAEEERGERFIFYDYQGVRLRLRAQREKTRSPPTPPRDGRTAHPLFSTGDPAFPTTPNRKSHEWSDWEGQSPMTQGSPWVEGTGTTPEGRVSPTPVTPWEDNASDMSEDQRSSPPVIPRAKDNSETSQDQLSSPPLNPRAQSTPDTSLDQVSPPEQNDSGKSEARVPRQWVTTPNTPLRGAAPGPELGRTV